MTGYDPAMLLKPSYGLQAIARDVQRNARRRCRLSGLRFCFAPFVLGLDHLLEPMREAVIVVTRHRIQICGVLEIPVSFAFDGSPGSSRFESSLPQYFTDFMRSEEGARLVEAFSAITDRNMRRSILRMVRRLAESVQGGAVEDIVQVKEPAS
jgi:hypothetical protein